MSFGDHLEELRGCLIRSLFGAGLAIVLALFFAKDLMAFMLRPLLVVLHNHGQRPEVMALSPPEAFLEYMRIGFLSGLIIAMPWILYQVWMFVAAGLYQRERRYVRMFIPLIGGLFAVGVAFLYWVVLPLALNFFIAFSASVELPELTPSWLQTLVLDLRATPSTTQPADGTQTVPLLTDDPTQPAPGAVWVNVREQELRVMTGQGLLMTPLRAAKKTAAITSQFSLEFYISFVLSLALAFGVSFELPVVVVFLSLTGIVRTAQMVKARRYVIFGIVVAAAVLTPTADILSLMLLAVPMFFLFEGGLLAARAMERGRKAAAV